MDTGFKCPAPFLDPAFCYRASWEVAGDGWGVEWVPAAVEGIWGSKPVDWNTWTLIVHFKKNLKGPSGPKPNKTARITVWDHWPDDWEWNQQLGCPLKPPDDLLDQGRSVQATSMVTGQAGKCCTSGVTSPAFLTNYFSASLCSSRKKAVWAPEPSHFWDNICQSFLQAMEYIWIFL